MSDIRQWLKDLGLERFADAFEREELTPADLSELSDDELKELGLPLGPRKRVLKAIEALRTGGTILPPHSSGSDATKPLAETILASNNGLEGERRQLTVLFCDMVGFTELANRVDPEVLQGIIRRYEDQCAVCVTRYEGYVYQKLGDAIVAFFGYPLAHEGEAERAIHAGLEIVAAFSKLEVEQVGHLQVRVGIATGLVVVSPARGAVGETMNLASRLQGIAQPGSIVVSERVQRLAGGSFEYHDLGAHTLKGIAQPTRAYRIAGVSEATSRFEAATREGLTPLVGREEELGLLLERWALAQDGKGQVVLLSGEPGIGKSRISTTLGERLGGQGAQALRLQCSPYYVNSAFWPSIDNFERALKFDRDEPPESKLDKLEGLIVTHYGRPAADVRFVASMLSIPCEQRYGTLAITPQKHKDETLRSLVDLVEAAARKQPTVMLYEDLHWNDPTSLELLDLLVDRVRGFPLLVVLTHRPEFEPRWSHHEHVTALSLLRLPRAQSAAMVLRVTGGKPLPGDLLEQILTKTDGVPLFLEELTKSFLESGELKDTGESYEYSGPTRQVAIPATLRDLLTARLDRSRPVKEIAQIGAVIGREFSHELIGAVAPLTPTQLDTALGQLIESGLAHRRGTPPEASYVFKHALIRDAAYDSLLKSRRQELHDNIARAIDERFPWIAQGEPEVLAHHNTQAGRHLSAIPLWQKAGELALARLALPETISHLNKGLELITALPGSAERDGHELALRIPLGTAWQALRGWANPEVWNSLHPALALAKSLGRNDALLPILWGLTLNVVTQGRIAEAFQWVKETLETAKATRDPNLSITGHVLANTYYYFIGSPHEALHHHREVLDLYDAESHGHLVKLLNHDPKSRTGAYASICTWMLGYPEQAVRLCRATDQHARDRAHPIDLGFALRMSAELFDFRSEPPEMRERADECERLGRENSLPVLWALIARFARGVALIREGKAAEGIGPLEAGLKYWDASGGSSHGVYLRAVLAEGFALLGDLDRALEIIAAQIAQIERPGWEERVYYAEILRLKGWMLSLKGDLEGAEQNYLASLDWAREQEAKSWELRTSISLARLWQAQGKRAEAYELVAPVYDWFTEGLDTKDLKDAATLLGELAPGIRASAPSSLRHTGLSR
jgi:class 3 adenylate cyclase/tetratricopeptide (TPR) repeat protein